MKILETDKAFFIASITIIIASLWAINTHWDYEPMLLLFAAGIEIVYYLWKKKYPTDEETPNVELSLERRRSIRGAPQNIPGVSPVNENGYFIQKDGGIYLFEIDQDYIFTIRNHSRHNAYKIVIYISNDERRISFKTKPTGEALTFLKPIAIEFRYEDHRQMTHAEAKEIYTSKMPLALKDLIFIVEYQTESGKKYYSQYSPMGGNVTLETEPFLHVYKKMYSS